jgi:hypothetical protein
VYLLLIHSFAIIKNIHSQDLTTMAPSKPLNESPDEITPLLPQTSNEPSPQTNGSSLLQNGPAGEPASEEEDETPLPMFQIFILCIARVMDPISFFSIFPFLPSMVKDSGVAEVDVGFYTGVIVCLFSILFFSSSPSILQCFKPFFFVAARL